MAVMDNNAKGASLISTMIGIGISVFLVAVGSKAIVNFMNKQSKMNLITEKIIAKRKIEKAYSCDLTLRHLVKRDLDAICNSASPGNYVAIYSAENDQSDDTKDNKIIDIANETNHIYTKLTAAYSARARCVPCGTSRPCGKYKIVIELAALDRSKLEQGQEAFLTDPVTYVKDPTTNKYVNKPLGWTDAYPNFPFECLP